MIKQNEVILATWIAETLFSKAWATKRNDERLIDLADHKLELIQASLPSGSGFDNGTKLIEEKSGDSKLVFETAFHHMDSNGSYCGWSNHIVTVRPSFVGKFDVKVSGPNKREIKPYIEEIFYSMLSNKEYETP